MLSFLYVLCFNVVMYLCVTIIQTENIDTFDTFQLPLLPICYHFCQPPKTVEFQSFLVPYITCLHVFKRILLFFITEPRHFNDFSSFSIRVRIILKKSKNSHIRQIQFSTLENWKIQPTSLLHRTSFSKTFYFCFYLHIQGILEYVGIN